MRRVTEAVLIGYTDLAQSAQCFIGRFHGSFIAIRPALAALWYASLRVRRDGVEIVALERLLVLGAAEKFGHRVLLTGTLARDRAH